MLYPWIMTIGATYTCPRRDASAAVWGRRCGAKVHTVIIMRMGGGRVNDFSLAGTNFRPDWQASKQAERTFQIKGTLLQRTTSTPRIPLFHHLVLPLLRFRGRVRYRRQPRRRAPFFSFPCSLGAFSWLPPAGL